MSLQAPPPSCTGLDAGHGPTETKPDFTTDVPPLIEISADDFLQDEQRMKKLTAALCDAVFSYPDQATIDKVIDDSLRLCGGSEETLSTVLQTKFFAGHTPFYWAIVNKEPKRAGVPPLLQKFFSIQMQQLSRRNDAGGHEPQPTARATSVGNCSCTVKFCIPLLFDRLVLDKEVCLAFIAMGSLWRLRAVVDGFPNPNLREWAWHFELTEKTSRYNYSEDLKYKRDVSISLEHSTEGKPPLLCSASQEISKVPSTTTVSIMDDDLKGFRHNTYTATRMRELAGRLEIKD